MNQIIKELLSLFVDDSSLAVVILLWVGLIKWLSVHFQWSASGCSGFLLLGLLAFLVENTYRSAKKIRGRKENSI